MEYNFKEDLKSIREILGLTQSQIAEKIGVEQITIRVMRWVKLPHLINC